MKSVADEIKNNNEFYVWKVKYKKAFFFMPISIFTRISRNFIDNIYMWDL